MYCQRCGVELEENMRVCPLCGTAVRHGENDEPVTQGKNDAPGPPAVSAGKHDFRQPGKRMNEPQKKFTWEIVSAILLSATIGALGIDLIINKRITWSQYSTAVNLAIFSYISVFAFWNVNTVLKLTGSFVLSFLLLFLLGTLTAGNNWSLTLAIPLLFTGNLVAAALITVIRVSKYKGVNLIAYGFIATGIQAVFVDAILSAFKTRTFHLEWSLIVVACVIPVVLVLLFVHFRLKKGRKLERLFHT